MCGQSKIITLRQIRSCLEKDDNFISITSAEVDLICKDVQTDSRKVGQNSLFVCIRGYEYDGHDFAAGAIDNGASILIVEHFLDVNAIQILVKSSRKAAAVLISLYLGNPAARLKLIGITGTNGKTSICQIGEQLFLKLGVKTGTIGTLGYSINGVNFPTARTTPDIIDLHEIFARMADAGIEYVLMEVSSHSIYLDRIHGLEFKIAVFTNLTQDHLDFHHTLEDYAETKFRFLRQTIFSGGSVICNLDDLWGSRFQKQNVHRVKGISFSSGNYLISEISYTDEETVFQLTGSVETRKFTSSLAGRLNLFNLATILAVFQEAGFSWEQISPFTSSLQPITGRLERIRLITDRRIYIDYAHSPDALEKVLSDLRLLKPQRIICLFGAGGNRDRSKRPDMLKSVLNKADLAFITNDNPRKEDPSVIIDDLVSSTHGSSRFWIIRDRKTAIQTAFRITRPEDILLIAGKGHETYQEIGSRKIPFSDKEQILSAAKMEFPSDRLVLPVDPLQLKHISSAEIISSTGLSAFYVSTDSRKIKDYSIFFALQGENFDGHNYVSEVLNKNNCLAVVAKSYLTEHPNLIKVDDPLKTLGDLAASYRNMFSTRLIAITGSVGKTTTKEYLANILAVKYRILKTNANENNLIGVPKTLFNLRTDHDFAVLELGTNHFGEIARLSAICKPEIALITQIGASHLEFLEDLDGVFREKTQIFSSQPHLRFVPGDEPKFNDFNAIKVGYDNTNDYQIKKVTTTNGATCFELNGDTYSITSPFRQFVINAAFAAAVAIELDIDPEIIRQGLSKSLETSMRMEIKMSGNRIILADCYNANPDSMLAAINFWQEYEPGRPHLAILGDMLELGKLTEKLHRKIWTRLKECNYERLIAVGKYAGFYGAEETYPDIQALIDSGIWKEFPADAVILLKASHALNLEKILERI